MVRCSRCRRRELLWCVAVDADSVSCCGVLNCLDRSYIEGLCWYDLVSTHGHAMALCRDVKSSEVN